MEHMNSLQEEEKKSELELPQHLSNEEINDPAHAPQLATTFIVETPKEPSPLTRYILGYFIFSGTIRIMN